MSRRDRGFSLVEILVVIGVIGILATIVLVAFSGTTAKARDTKRKAELSQIGQYLMGFSCYLPDGGPGEYDIMPLAQELAAKNPQYANFLKSVPKDPKTGNALESKYFYIVNADASRCALYANLEDKNDKVTLRITTPTPGGGKGVFREATTGWNGSDLYYQVSN